MVEEATKAAQEIKQKGTAARGLKTLQGKVTSAAMNKSRVVTVRRVVKIGNFGKYVRRDTKYMFHDEDNASRVGDVVTIVPSRPISARKSFRLSQIVSRAAE
jgi:small subunit ribosomal protein S17